MSDIHSCSYYCTRPACVLAQRDELRDKLHKQQAEPVGQAIAGAQDVDPRNQAENKLGGTNDRS